MEKILSEQTTLGNNLIKLISLSDDISFDSVSLVVGVVHGDEPQGKYLIDKYIEHCKTNNIKPQNLLFIPCLNPDGMQKNTRTNLNGVDINRNFSTKNWGKNEGENATCDDSSTQYYGGEFPSSEIETKFLTDVIEKYKPKLVLTIHSPYRVVNYDGNALDMAQKIAKILNYPVESSIGYPTPGSFGTYCGIERNIPTITLELDENSPIEDLYKPMFEIFETL